MKWIIYLILFQSISVFSQSSLTENEIGKYACSNEKLKTVREYFKEFEAIKEFISECEFKTEQNRKTLNLPKTIKVSGFGPGAVNLVKPYYPTLAQNLKISETVLIEVLTDEKGFVIASKPLRCLSMFHQSARRAACASRFTPVIYCEKPIKLCWLIQYNFLSWVLI